MIIDKSKLVILTIIYIIKPKISIPSSKGTIVITIHTIKLSQFAYRHQLDGWIVLLNSHFQSMLDSIFKVHRFIVQFSGKGMLLKSKDFCLKCKAYFQHMNGAVFQPFSSLQVPKTCLKQFSSSSL